MELPCVAIVDDEALVSRALATSLTALGFDVCEFRSSAEFLAAKGTIAPRIGCTIVDLRLSEENGLHLIKHLNEDSQSLHRPTIAISGFADVDNTVEALTSGCWTLLQKPIDLQVFRQTVSNACHWSNVNRARCQRTTAAYGSWKSINDKEKSTIDLILEGLPNKAVAKRLGVSVRTIENRRRQVFAKLGIQSVAQLGQVVAAVEERHLQSRHEVVGDRQGALANVGASNEPQSARLIRRPNLALDHLARVRDGV